MTAQSIDRQVTSLSRRARGAALDLQTVSPRSINEALTSMASLIASQTSSLKRANARDCAAARGRGMAAAMVDRLTLSDTTLAAMIRGLKEVAALPSPVGRTYERRRRPNGLVIEKLRVPIGVVGIIYESRPNVTVDAAAICLKSQNAVILRGGSEAFHSNTTLVRLFSQALRSAGVPSAAIQLIPTVDRRAIESMLCQEEFIDLVIPRGGEGLIRMVVEKSRIPVIKHYKGICHVYVSVHADLHAAIPIVVNAKTQRPGVCNAMETLLLDARLSAARRKRVIDALLEKGVTIFGDPATRALSKAIRPARKEDWGAEYLDLRLAVRTVRGLNEAIDHINAFGSHHTDAILTGSKREADEFLQKVDSSSVMVNASTRFSDGGEYGLGCEIGISTDKLHARGPMGIEDLTTYKWIVRGSGQVR